MSRPFIVTIASEKGGVGKTTIATNLAVYLKALREDLPVTIASFDNHFSIDQMFAIGGHSAGSVADLLAGHQAEECVGMGEYGVQFIASERRCLAPEQPPQKLCDLLRGLALTGVLVLDTRPILDWFTQGALLAADLVLVPVKDRASLVNVAAIKSLLEASGAAQNLWLVPSLVDARARLNAAIKVKDFLVYSAGERDYQVIETFISKSPKVESLASGFSSRIYPVLTHARQTAVHGQFRKLADFVLERFDNHRPDLTETLARQGIKTGRLRRLASECPLCAQNSLAEPGHFYFDLRSRRCGFIHPHCLGLLRENLEGMLLAEAGSGMAISLTGPGVVGPEAEVVCHLVDEAGELSVSEQVGWEENCMRGAFEGMTGRMAEEWHRETILLELQQQRLTDFTDDTGWQAWRGRRRQLLRALHLL